jgi:glucokinase
VASGSGIETCYRLAGGDAVGGAEISRRALAGEELARSVIEQAGRSLGEAIASWADVVDPELVVVAGSVCNAGELWRAALDEGLAARLAPELAGLRVVEAALGGDAPLVGAAEQLRDRLAG